MLPEAHPMQRLPCRRLFRAVLAGLLLLAAGGHGQAQAPEAWPQLLERRDYAALNAAIAGADERRRAGALDARAFRRMLGPLGGLRAEDAGKFDDWVAAAPGNGYALLARGWYLNSEGWRARGGKWARDTPPERFERMDAYFDRASGDLEQAASALPRCDLCYALLINMAKARGQREDAAALLAAAMAADPGAVDAPLAYLEMLEPRWGGEPGEGRAFVDRFAREFAASPARRVLDAELLVQGADEPYKAGRYAEAAALFQRAIEIDPHRYLTLYRLAYAQGKLKQYDAALTSVTASLALNPRQADALGFRGWVLAELGRVDEALPDLERAAGLGDSYAVKEALLIYARGHRGGKPDYAKSWRVCQAALKAELAEGYACTGGHYYFGFHVQQDRPEAAKWFRIAADRGFGEAMVDLGIMLWSGDGVTKDEDAAIGYWRAAKRAGEERGEQKLRAHLSGWRYLTRVTLPDWWDALVAVPVRRTWDGIRSLFA